MSTGAVTVTVQDPAGAAVNGAQLELKDLDTNSTRTAATQRAGIATFPDLSFGHYSLTITKAGFATKIYSAVLVQTNQITPINAKLSVGAVSQQVTVTAESSPLLDSTSNTLSTTVDLKQVQDLPVFARDTFPLAFLVPGAAAGGNGFPGDVDVNNLPGGALNASMNGFSVETQRNKTEGFDYNTPVATARLEDVQEMTVQTGELDASKGGTAAMDIGVVTKRGTNKFHGLLFWDYRNDALNANSWINNATNTPRAKLIINDFGGSLGGPFLKNKLFFFASLANFRQPLKATVSTEVATPRALSGIYDYIPQGSSSVQSINVLQAAAKGGCSTCSGVINPNIQTELNNIESTYNLAGATLTPLDLNHDTLNFLAKEYVVQKYPTARVDYNVSQNFHLIGSANETAAYDVNTGPGPYPGPIFANQTTSGITKGYQIVAGFDWTIKPNVVNAFRVGYLYNGFTFSSQGTRTVTPAMSQQTWGFGMNSGINAFNNLKGGQLYPVLSVKDDTTWQHGAHTISFGGEASTEIDHYYNQPLGFPEYTMNAIASGDPVATPLNAAIPANAPASVPGDVQSLYATLTGRINYVQQPEFLNIYTKQYGIGNAFNLHERLTNSALFFEDSWKVNPELTLNYGLRWDFIGASKDETGAYTSPTIAALWGPSGVNGLFQPGNLPGDRNPVLSPNNQPYSPSYVQPQPNFGFAWNPHGTEGLLGKLLGGGKNVIRGSYTFKNYTEGAQNFWNFGSDNGFNYQPNGVLQPAPGVVGKGFFEPGTLSYGNPLPPVLLSPATYQPVVTEASVTFNNAGFLAFNPHIKQPWVESWALGIQHQFSQNNVLEVRYVGNVSRDQWLGVNYDEINIFENGFLSEFKKAQSNLAASGGTSFEGPQSLPIMSTAFASAGGNSNFTNGQFTTYLQQGQAGAFANALATNAGYLCSMVGAANFSPCAANGASGSGTYPINFWQANPYAAGSGIFEMTNDGFSNYNSLQMDFRQRPTHNMQFDVNYTFSHSLTMNQQRSITPGYYSAPAYYTLRDKHRNYGPSVYDIRHVLHVSGTYDLPFGRGREFLNRNRLVDAVVGGWTLGTILSYQSGPPMLFVGGTETVNSSDSGVVLTGVSPSQLQHAIGIHRITGIPRVAYIDPKYINANGQANTQYISPEFTAGQFGRVLYLHGPRFITTDMELSKTIPIRGNLNFQLQAAAFNVFNHPAWSVGSNGLPSNGADADTGVQDNTFGTISGFGSTTVSQPRNIEIRANLRF